MPDGEKPGETFRPCPDVLPSTLLLSRSEESGSNDDPRRGLRGRRNAAQDDLELEIREAPALQRGERRRRERPRYGVERGRGGDTDAVQAVLGRAHVRRDAALR